MFLEKTSFSSKCSVGHVGISFDNLFEISLNGRKCLHRGQKNAEITFFQKLELSSKRSNGQLQFICDNPAEMTSDETA